MADLAPEAGDRAQLLIVASVAFAIILISLALTLNTAVYSDVHVAQTDTGSTEERRAIQYQQGVERGIATILPVTAEDESESALETRLRKEVDRWGNLTRAQYARDGIATNLSVVSVTYQDRIVHDNESRPFTDQSRTADWTVVSNVSDASSFQMTIRNESLVTADSDAFQLTVVGANSNTWILSADSNADGDTLVDINGTEYQTNESVVEIDLANGIFDTTGEQAQFTSFVDDETVDPPYEIAYSNADNVTGTYYISDDDLTINASRYNDVGSPRDDIQVGSATLTVTYQSPALRYQNDIRAEVGADNA